MSHACLRICCRALLLIILCTARGVYAKLEQPASSVMNYMPDFDSTGALISDHLGMWREVFLPSPQALQQPNLLSELDGQLGSQNPKAQSSLGDRAGVSVSRPRKCLFHLPRLWLEELYRKFGHAEREELLQEAKAQGLQVTVKYKKKQTGSGVCPVLSIPTSFLSWRHVNRLTCTLSRHGGKDLKATQVYPQGYGNLVTELHLFLMDWYSFYPNKL